MDWKVWSWSCGHCRMGLQHYGSITANTKLIIRRVWIKYIPTYHFTHSVVAREWSLSSIGHELNKWLHLIHEQYMQNRWIKKLILLHHYIQIDILIKYRSTYFLLFCKGIWTRYVIFTALSIQYFQFLALHEIFIDSDVLIIGCCLIVKTTEVDAFWASHSKYRRKRERESLSLTPMFSASLSPSSVCLLHL